MAKKLEELKHVTYLFSFLLVAWGFYRLLFQFPEPYDELVVKPIVWLVPTLYFVSKEKKGFKSLGFTTKNIFPSVYFALGLGVLFAIEAMLINFIKHDSFDFGANIGGDQTFYSSLILSFITAVSEETAFRGYIFNRIWEVGGKEQAANLLTSFGWILIHVPIAVIDWKMTTGYLLVYLFLIFVYSVGACYVFAKTKNIFSVILLHVLWQWPIILFR